MTTNNINNQENLICVMTLSQDQAFDILRYYEDNGIDYVTMESEQIIGIYDILVPESKVQEIQPYTDAFFKNQENAASESVFSDNEPDIPVNKAAVYSSKAAALEDVRSSAYTLMLVGAAGLLFSILILLDVIHLPVNDLVPIVMTAMFSVFFIVGILNFKKIASLEEAASQEASQTDRILQWFKSTYSASDIDSRCQLSDSEETNYFKRAEYIKELILLEYTLEDEYLDSLIEPIYSSLFD